MRRVGVLVSGRGSNLQALIAAAREGRLGGEVAVVISNVAEVPALDRARAAGVPAVVCDHRGRPREEHDRAVLRVLQDHGVDLVCLAGYMRLLSAPFLSALSHRVVNIHPALLPAFPGVHAQAQALAYGVRVTGCTVHLVDAGMDTGPILAQTAVPILDGDDEATLRERLLLKEHELLPAVLQWIADGRVEVTPAAAGARPRVRIKPAR